MADHVFAYGSLADDLGIRARAATLYAHRRVWGVAMDNSRTIPGYKVFRLPDGVRPDVCVAFLDLEPHAGAAVDGVLIPVTSQDLEALDRRERQYHRMDVTDTVADAPPGRVYAYLGREESRERLRRARRAGRAVVAAGYARAVARFAATTVPHGLPEWELVRVDLPA
jgi:hypothetical protein